MSRRRAGVLAHPTSLPGPFGVGDVGPSAFAFCDWVAAAGQSVWQLLPVGPTGRGHSPYACLSAFAGNPLLISPEWLHRQTWLPRKKLARSPTFPVTRVDFGRAESWKHQLLRESWEYFKSRASPESKLELERFVEAPEQACWLGEWSMFAALKDRFAGRAWFQWDPDLKCRRPSALRSAAAELADTIAFHRYLQFVFFSQWAELRRHARSLGIELLGDVPIYVAHDSADVWAHHELFQLDERRDPIKVAGVPPDYFSETGQLWGNPLFRWDRMAVDGYAWWIDRLRATLRLADRVRLDHFRGFAAYWEVDAHASTAEHGRWVPGPGLAFFREVESALGGLPFVAEDLGVITDDVRALRRELGLPGMRVLQFALGDDDNEHHPENHTPDSVVYTGTHDNDTARGWFSGLDDDSRSIVLDSLSTDDRRVVRRLVELAYDSVADLAIIPLQDLFDLGSQARMNTPGVSDGNWSWRVSGRRLTAKRAAKLRTPVERSGRSSIPPEIDPPQGL